MLVLSFKEQVVQKGFDKLTVHDVTDGAGVSRSTFYLYFKDKYDVVEYIFHNEIGNAARPLIEMGFLKEAFLRVIVQIKKEKPFYSRLYASEEHETPAEFMRRVLLPDVLRMVEGNERTGLSFNGLITDEMIAKYVINILHFVIDSWLKGPDVSLETVMAGFDAIMEKPLGELLGHRRGG